MSMLLLHKDVEFIDDTLYLSGHAYYNCKFVRCTMIVRDNPLHMVQCTFEGCVWHLDMVIHTQEQITNLRGILPLIEGSLPGATEVKVKAEDFPPEQSDDVVSSASEPLAENPDRSNQ